MRSVLSRRDCLGYAIGGVGAATLASCQTSAPKDDRGDIPLKVLAEAKGLRFGTAVNQSQLSDEKYVEIVRRECGSIVAENEHKRHTINPAPDVWNYGPGDAIASFAKDNDLHLRGHTLLWHKAEWSPKWVNELEFKTTAEAEAQLRNYVTKLAQRYNPQVYAWDVVNEAIDDQTGAFRETSFSAVMGENIIDYCFQLAQEHAPDARLVYNDYMSWEGVSAAHRNGVLRFLERLLKRGVPVQGLGIQSHSNAEMPDEFTRVKRKDWIMFCDEVVDLGLEIYVTEFDVNDTRMTKDIAYRDQAMASYTKDYFDIMLSYSELKEILIWGMVDDQNWLQGFMPRTDGIAKRPTLYDENYKPKAMRQALANSLQHAPQREQGFF